MGAAYIQVHSVVRNLRYSFTVHPFYTRLTLKGERVGARRAMTERRKRSCPRRSPRSGSLWRKWPHKSIGGRAPAVAAVPWGALRSHPFSWWPMAPQNSQMSSIYPPPQLPSLLCLLSFIRPRVVCLPYLLLTSLHSPSASLPASISLIKWSSSALDLQRGAGAVAVFTGLSSPCFCPHGAAGRGQGKVHNVPP